MKILSSLQNPEIKDVISLHVSKGRKEHQKFIAEGIRVIITIIESGLQPIVIYATEPMIEQAKKLVTSKQLTVVSIALMKKISTASTPSGLLAVFEIPKISKDYELSPGLVLAQVSDPGNVGTLIRICAAMNLKTLVIIEGVDPYNPKVVQSSAGYIAQVNIFTITWQELLKQKKDLKLFALVVEGGKDIKKIKNSNALLVIGSEAHGIPQAWTVNCDEKLTISMPGNTESLNAAIAGSIAAYEIFGT